MFSPKHAFQMLIELDGHSSFVNSICFDKEGTHLYSGDNTGTIYVWNVFVTDKPSSNGLLKEWTQNKKIADAELQVIKSCMCFSIVYFCLFLC